MKILKMAALSLALINSAAYAVEACDGFRITLKNDLADDLILHTIKLKGATIQPDKFEILKGGTSQVFTVSDSAAEGIIKGRFVLHTKSIPTKKVKIIYHLENKSPACSHTNKSPQSDYKVDEKRKLGEVEYSIVNG